MSNLIKKGQRNYKLERRKTAIKNLRDFGGIINSMGLLDEFIQNHPGQVTKENILEIANNYNFQNKLNLQKEQIDIVLKRYLND